MICFQEGYTNNKLIQATRTTQNPFFKSIWLALRSGYNQGSTRIEFLGVCVGSAQVGNSSFVRLYLFLDEMACSSLASFEKKITRDILIDFLPNKIFTCFLFKKWIKLV
jgi:hypothetical protein